VKISLHESASLAQNQNREMSSLIHRKNKLIWLQNQNRKKLLIHRKKYKNQSKSNQAEKRIFQNLRAAES
jgi:hypothetical protein